MCGSIYLVCYTVVEWQRDQNQERIDEYIYIGDEKGEFILGSRVSGFALIRSKLRIVYSTLFAHSTLCWGEPGVMFTEEEALQACQSHLGLELLTIYFTRREKEAIKT